ncbi:hypothetical protein SAMN04488563_0834 [Jiangella alkaliphila]|uniref:Uncharacterized protein n=1 Tax=Jiangella alkaliphila TaxID=419479 RepID=A0A1H2H490_9ACTN|nr:hypothetical protein SAMN04488563_0834 [Jiangella alkaliphila]
MINPARRKGSGAVVVWSDDPTQWWQACLDAGRANMRSLGHLALLLENEQREPGRWPNSRPDLNDVATQT